jgi:hypothetical protein
VYSFFAVVLLHGKDLQNTYLQVGHAALNMNLEYCVRQ